MPYVARAVERNVPFQIGQERKKLLPDERRRILECVLSFAFLGNDDVVFGMEVAPPEDAVSQRLKDEALSMSAFSAFGPRNQE